MLRFSTSARRFVAATAALLFLACQGASIAYAQSAGAPGSVAAQGSCHDPGQETGKTAGINACQSSCQSQLTPSVSSGAIAAADLIAITTRVDRVVAVVDSAPQAPSSLLQFEPPPLTILHCCLRN